MSLLPPDAWAIFRKDGLEVLRDRRTLFVNLFLPVLLYPLVLLFLMQVLQLTQAQVRERPRVGVVGAPADLQYQIERLAGLHQKAPTDSVDPAASATAAATEAESPKAPAHRSPLSFGPAAPGPFEPVQDGPELARLGELLAPVLGAGGVTPAPLTDEARREALFLLRSRNLASAVVVAPGESRPVRIAILIDEANSRLDEVRGLVDQAIGAWRQQLVERSLTDAGLDVAVLRPVLAQPIGLAPPAEAVRTRIAGSIPWILVMLAVAAAFNPAIDLMAGERERGTLETLLALPARRRDIVLGKLLVVCAAALAAVILNLLSLGLSAVLLGAQMSAATGGAGIDLMGSFSVGASALVLCFVVLAPLVVAIAALAIGIAGFAASAKEAQNYLTPLLLVVMFAAIVVLIPTARPSIALDLVPITGAVLALKEALQSPHLPWLHLIVATLANVALAAVIVSWSTQLLEKESFRYPGLVRAGWGRWRKWWRPGERESHLPGGIEVLIVYAVAVAGFTLGGGLLANQSPVVVVVGPLLLFIAVPAALHCWAGAYDPRTTLGLRWPGGRGIAGGLLLLPLGIGISMAISALQGLFVDAGQAKETEQSIQKIVDGIGGTGGIGLLVLCLGVAPGICEELLCRGTLLTGLRRGVGTPWAVVLSAFLFAALHMNPLRFGPQMCLGILLALVTLRTRSVIPAMLIHAGHNGSVVFWGWLTDDPPAWLKDAMASVEKLPSVDLWLPWALLAATLVPAVIGWRLIAPKDKPVDARDA